MSRDKKNVTSSSLLGADETEMSDIMRLQSVDPVVLANLVDVDNLKPHSKRLVGLAHQVRADRHAGQGCQMVYFQA
jgi:hypothetical protein